MKKKRFKIKQKREQFLFQLINMNWEKQLCYWNYLSHRIFLIWIYLQILYLCILCPILKVTVSTNRSKALI